MSQIVSRGIWICGISQESTDTDGGSRNTDNKHISEAGIDVAIDFTVPPGVEILAPPNERINKAEQVDDHNPANQEECSIWTTRDFPVEVCWWKAEEEANAREDAERVVGHGGLWYLGKC